MKNIKVEIDSESGFCYGVIRAIEKAEINLKDNDSLYSLGAIVHNNAELNRLNESGLRVIDIEQMKNINNTSVLIRAHGEPPITYLIARERNIDIIDCTCPVVLKLQEKIRDTYNYIKSFDSDNINSKGQIIIFGKRGHAEVNGLVGQVNSDAIIIDTNKLSTCSGLSGQDKEFFVGKENEILFYSNKLINYKFPLHIFSQTTKDPKEYEVICSILRQKAGDESLLSVHNTICKQVAQRHKNLVEFARKHSLILFVSGKESSNGKVLYELCKSVNSNTYSIESYKDINDLWIRDNELIGICGATSTPKWQLEEVANFLKSQKTANI